MTRLDPAAQRRLESCLALAKRGATAGERDAAKAAAERIANAAGLTLDQAQECSRAQRPTPQPNWAPPPKGHGWTPPPGWHGRSRRRAKPTKPPTVADQLREKAEEVERRRKRAAAADRRFYEDHADQFVWEAEQRKAQAERDRAWAASQSTEGGA